VTLIAWSGVDESFLKSLIVIPTEKIDTDIALTGPTDEKVAIYSQPKDFIDQPVVWPWFEDVFISEICRRCARYQDTGNVVLRMEVCTAR
jgi:hypothetical protein